MPKPTLMMTVGGIVAAGVFGLIAITHAMAPNDSPKDFFAAVEEVLKTRGEK